ncbi:MAG: mechanosensitive ion channel [Planctomycetota bacterium]|nr:mechanosensitive ion channel [Planctomycetota bacterium]
MTSVPHDQTNLFGVNARTATFLRSAFVAFFVALTLLASPASAQAPAASPAPAPATTPAPEPVVPLLGARQDEAAAGALIGSWSIDSEVAPLTLILKPDGRFSLDGTKGTYSVHGNQIALSTAVGKTTYDFDLTQTSLILRGGDLRKDTTFLRQTAMTDYVAALVELSPSAVRHKLTRIGIVMLIVIGARVLISALQGLSQFIVSNDWGPLGLVWRHNKARVRTIHSLVLNVVKYFIYFTALGIVLSELGINYATYLASLSVVGLAIGFGSQGLVQDMVTGFFVIFESQFDVGDMVDLSGQTGVVTELGLRMTKIRNYFGQVVVIPNRNISVVGNYKLGSQLALIDVAVPGPEADAAATATLAALSREMNIQFAGVLMNEPVVEGAVTPSEGGRFIRLRVLFWPGQTWVVDQQLVPRITELFKPKAEGAAPSRVVVFYHPHEEIKVVDWRAKLQERLHWPLRHQTGTHPAQPQGQSQPQDHQGGT